MKIFTCLVALFSCVFGYGEQTLSIIKPDAVCAHKIGSIISHCENGGLKMVAGKLTQLTKSQAEEFYSVHRERPFYNDLVSFMISGPIFVMVLEADDAVARNRKLMGPTDSKKAEKGTIRGDFGTDVQKNAVHGSDAAETAKNEIAFFFKPNEIYSY